MRSKQIGLVVSALILGLLLTMDNEDRAKASYIRYFQLLKYKCRGVKLENEVRNKLAYVARDAMMALVDVYKDDSSAKVLQVSTFVLSLSYSFENELKSFAGGEYFTLMHRFTDKINESSVYAKSSYILSDTLRDNIRKLIFDRMK
jgi:hypothetical protein